MDVNNTDDHDDESKPTRTNNRDEIWKEQIRLAIEESQRNIEQNQAARLAPEYRITLHAPRITKSYYDKVREENLRMIRLQNSRKHGKSDTNVSKRDKASTATSSKVKKGLDDPNVQSTTAKYKEWVERDAGQEQGNMQGPGKATSSETGANEDNDEMGGEGADGEAPSTAESITDAENVLSYFDPNYVKAEFQEVMEKSRNIAIGPPAEILKKYFGYKDRDQIPIELQFDDSPKAFILPRKMWREYDDTTSSVVHAPASSTVSAVPHKIHSHHETVAHLFDKRLLKRMNEEKEIEPFIPRQPKNFAVDYLARHPFQKHGLLSSNLNDASPGKMEHLEMKEVNVDPGGHLRRDLADKHFKISDVTETQVKVAPKEGPLKDDKRPWYADDWADDADPETIKKSPNFTTGDDTDFSPETGKRGSGKHEPKGKGARGSDDPDQRKSPGKKSRRGSSESSSGSYSCTCGDSSTDSSSSSETGSEEEDKKSRKKGKHRHSGEKGSLDEDPSKKDVAVDASIKVEAVPPWAPSTWKPPPGYKGWIYKPETTQSAPDTSMNFDEDGDDVANGIPASDWFRAFGVIKKAEKDGDIEKLRDILGVVEGEEDLRLFELEKLAAELEMGENEKDPMERLSRGDLTSSDMHPEAPKDHFKYYRSYPLYPTLSNERYFEWYKDVNRLADPFGRRKHRRPAGISKSLNSINWDDPKEAAKWYAYGYRRPDTKPKPERPDYNTKDYIYDNARSIMLMPPRKVVPKYIDDRKGTSHLLEPSGLVRKFIFRGDFGKVPGYLVGINEELGRPPYPDMDKFYRPHRCKYLHGHIHCKICMRAHPTVKARKIDWQCDMTPRDYERALEYRKDRRLSNINSNSKYSYSPSSHHRKVGEEDDFFNERLNDDYRQSNNARGDQNLDTVHSHNNTNIHLNVIYPPVYV